MIEISMRKGWLITGSLVLILVILGAAGCDNSATNQPNFNFIFKYGVGAKNVLDTFKGEYTKDMVLGPSVTVPLSLSEDEMDRIYQKMVEIDFFNYPERFSVVVPPGELTGMVTPFSSYYFKAEYHSQIKELWWEDEITNKDEKADKLRELINLIRGIVESKDEYKKLPEPRSAYQ